MRLPQLPERRGKSLLQKVVLKLDKLQFVGLIGGLIGGRVFNPRQQQVAYSRLAREHT